MTCLSYPEVGATLSGAPIPEGYRRLVHRTRIGHGRAVFEAAGEWILTWRMHRAIGVGIITQAEQAAPGVRVDAVPAPVKDGKVDFCNIAGSVNVIASVSGYYTG